MGSAHDCGGNSNEKMGIVTTGDSVHIVTAAENKKRLI